MARVTHLTVKLAVQVTTEEFAALRATGFDAQRWRQLFHAYNIAVTARPIPSGFAVANDEIDIEK